MKTIKFIAALVMITLVNIAAVLYFNNYFLKQDKKPNDATMREPASIKEVGLREISILAAGLDNVHRQAILRDTVILKQILSTQHHLKMHGKRVPMCPDCSNNKNAETKFATRLYLGERYHE